MKPVLIYLLLVPKGPLDKMNSGENFTGIFSPTKEQKILFQGHSQTAAQTHLDENGKTMKQFHRNLFILLEEINNFSLITQSETNDMMMIDGLVQTPTASKEVDFLMPFYKIKTCFFFRHPKKSAIGFLKPFSVGTWGATLVVSLIITVFLKISLVLSDAEETSWVFSALTVFSTLCQDGDDPSPSERAIGCKLIFFSLLIMSLLISNYYTSSMVSELLSSETDTLYTINDITRSKFLVGIDDNAHVRQWIRSTNFRDVKNLLQNKFLINSSRVDGIERVRRGGFAYHTDTYTGYDLIGRTFDQEEICDLSQVQMTHPVMAGLALPKQSRFRESFQISLLKLNQNGIVHRLKMVLEKQKPRCYSSGDVVALGMGESLPAFLCLVVGVMVSVGILGVEVVRFQFKTR